MALIDSLKELAKGGRPRKAKLIFNSAAGKTEESATQLSELLDYLQAINIRPDVFLVHPADDLRVVARKAVHDGYRLIIVSGGDGTIENVALGLVGTHATLGIIPTGTRNNLARSLGIPNNNVAEAAALLRTGRRTKIDVGRVRYGNNYRYFLETVAVGLASALYPAADDLQHGDLGKITEIVSTFFAHAPSEIRLRLDDSHHEIVTSAHMVLIVNMPYVGGNFQIGPDILFDDHYLDVFVYSNLSKLDLIGHAVQLTTGAVDHRAQRFHAKKIQIVTNPPMPVMADGVLLKDGRVTVAVHSRSLRVMANLQPTVAPIIAPEAIIHA
jgi:YegS/Rv2252/BmrU family lipid kinase